MTTNVKIKTLLRKCDKTIGLWIQIINTLNSTHDDSNLRYLVNELHEELGDGTLEQAQAEIRDMIDALTPPNCPSRKK